MTGSERPNAQVTAMLSVRDCGPAIDFYRSAFGATVLYRYEEDGVPVVAQLSVAGAAFWLANESPAHFNFSPETLGGGSVRMMLIVEDPDAYFEQALAAGATEVYAVGEEHGWRMGRVVDPFGHHWEIGKPLTS